MSDRGRGIDELTEQEEAIRRGVLKYLESPAFDRVHEQFDPYWQPAAAERPMTAFRSLLSAITMPFASQQSSRDDEARRARKEEVIRRASRSIPVILYPVLIPADFDRSPSGVGPARYAGTIDPGARTSREIMNRVVSRAASEAEATVDWEYHPHRWIKLRDADTAGVTVYLFDVLLAADFLPDGAAPPLPFLIEPEEGGQVLAAPTRVVAEALRDAAGR